MRYHETPLQVRFNEIDAYRVAWHGHYVAWMEVGRSNFAAQFGLDADSLFGLGFFGPVINLEVRYLSPARFNDEILVRTALHPTETATLAFLHEIVAPDGRKLATGITTHALTDTGGVMQFKLPAVVSERLDSMKKWLAAP